MDKTAKQTFFIFNQKQQRPLSSSGKAGSWYHIYNLSPAYWRGLGIGGGIGEVCGGAEGVCRATASHVTEASVEATPPQVVGYDDVGDGVKDKLDVVGVGGAGHVGVHLLVGRLVLGLVLTLDVGDAL